MVPIEDRGGETNDAVRGVSERDQHAPRWSIPSPTRFLLQWVTATLLGAGVVATLGAAVLGSNAYYPPWRLALFLGLVGLGVGAGQAVVIARLWAGSQRPLLWSICWLLGTGIGLGMGVVLGWAIAVLVMLILSILLGYHWFFDSGDGPLVLSIVWGMAAVVIVSLTQQLLLRKYANAKRFWKFASVAAGLVASFVAWGIGLAAGYGVGAALPAIPVLQGVVGGVVGGLILGALTGLAMLRMVSGGNSPDNAAAPKDPEAEG